jgi:hypothetical protein
MNDFTGVTPILHREEMEDKAGGREILDAVLWGRLELDPGTP